MKRAGNLYTQIADMANLELAHRSAKRGKGHYVDVRMVDQDPQHCLSQIHATLMAKTYRTAPYSTKMIWEPKERVIYKLPYYPDRIVHHAIMRVLQPIWDPTFISDCYSAIPGKGLHSGMAKLRRSLRDREHTKYCLKFDIRQFYPSVNHDVLMQIIERKIKCRDTLWLLEDIVRSPGGETNIPIGNYLSQYFANLYLSGFDHWLKEQKQIKYYIRYNDDGTILHSDKVLLHELQDEIREYLRDNLKLTLHKKTQVFPVDVRGVDFLGYRTFRDYALLRKSSAKRLKRKMARITNGHYSAYHVICSVMSYLGWLKYCNAYHLRQKYICNPTVMSVMETAARDLNIRNPMARLEYA